MNAGTDDCVCTVLVPPLLIYIYLLNQYARRISIFGQCFDPPGATNDFRSIAAMRLGRPIHDERLDHQQFLEIATCKPEANTAAGRVAHDLRHDDRISKRPELSVTTLDCIPHILGTVSVASVCERCLDVRCQARKLTRR